MDRRQHFPTLASALPPSPGAPLMPLCLPPPPFAHPSLPPHVMPPPPPPTPGNGSGGDLSPSVLLDEEAFWAVHEMVLADEANAHGGPPGQQQHHHQHHHTQPSGGYDTFLLDPATGELQLQAEAHDHHSEADSDSDSDSDSEEDDDDDSDGEGRRRGSCFGSGTAPPFHLPPSILGSHLARLRPANGAEAGKVGGPTTRSRGRGRNGATGARRGGRGGGAGGGGRALDGDQLTRRLRQKAESYERKKSRAKAGRKVLKERFETLLKACGDSRIRRSDKVGLLTRAIDLIRGLRKQLTALKCAGGPVPRLPPLGLDDTHGGDGPLGVVNFPSPPSTRDGKKRAAAGRRARHPQQHHSAVEGGGVLARGGGGKMGAGSGLGSRMWVEVPLVPLDGLARCFAAAPKAAFAVLDCLDPRSLATGRAVARTWRDWHSQELPWRELCRRRWRLAPDDGPALEELRAALPLPSALATWRQVYAFHHRAALPPRGPVTPTLLGPHAANRLLLAHASVNGVAAWLFLGAVPAGPAPALLPFRLLLQNLAHDTALVPYQRLRLVSSSCSMDVDEAPPRARAISNISVGTSLAAASSGSSGSEGEGEDADADGHADVDAFFLDHEEKGDEVPPLPVSKQPKQAAKGGAGPCVVARNERRLDGAARIPWRRFKGTEGGPLRLGLFDTAVLALPLPLPAGCPADTPLPPALLASAAKMAIIVLSSAPQRNDDCSGEGGGDQVPAAFVEARLVLALGPQQHMI